MCATMKTHCVYFSPMKISESITTTYHCMTLVGYSKLLAVELFMHMIRVFETAFTENSKGWVAACT